MTEYRINCWKKMDLFTDPDAAATAGPAPQSPRIQFQVPGAAAVEILIKADASGNTLPKTATLGEDAILDGACYPAGSRIVPMERFGAVSNHVDGLVVGIVETETGTKSDVLVFASGCVPVNQSFETVGEPVPENTLEQSSFVRGTLIETPHGAIPVEQLEEGDEVMTPDGGIQLITDLRRQRYSGLDLALFPSLVPVRIMAGALTGGRPGHDLIVSQKHRLLVDDWRAAYLFGEDEILVPAKSLLNNKSVVLEDHRAGVEYFQISVENGGMVCANGLWAETSAVCVGQGDLITGTAFAEPKIAALPRASAVALVA